MPTITSISPQKRKGRYSIYIDGKFVFGTDEDTLIKKQLTVGKEINEWELERLIEESEVGKFYQKVLRFLEYRPRSEWEVRGYLSRKLLSSKFQIPKDEHEQVINSIIERLKQVNYVNDERFARWWVEQRREFKPRGKILLRQELYQKGIDRKIAEQAIKQSSYQSEFELARKAAQKKLKTHKTLEPFEFRRKMGAYLARKGFEWETIKRVVDEFLKKR